jgi:large repetitive protein
MNSVSRIITRAMLFVGVVGFLSSARGQVASDDFYMAPAGLAFAVSAPGVLTNDNGGGAMLKAALIAGPTNGTLVLNNDGSFVYTPTNNFTGVDGFLYSAKISTMTSAPASVLIMVLPPGELFHDNFYRPTNNGSRFPWRQYTDAHMVTSTWAATNNLMMGAGPAFSYGYVYYSQTNWTNYSVQAQIRFSANYAASAGVLGRLNVGNGAHYALWVYPELSNEYNIPPLNGIPRLWLIKYQSWTNYTFIGQWSSLPAVGTNWHTVKLAFQGNRLFAYFDGTLVTNVTDNGSIDGQPAYDHGALGLNMWISSAPPYTFWADNCIATALAATANNDAYTMTAATGPTLHVPAPGILTNDLGNGSLTALLVGGPAGGSLTLTNNGGFSYTPTNGFIGTDSFTYQCSDSQSTSGVATVSITVSNSVVASNDVYSLMANTVLSAGPPGILANDLSQIGSLAAVLAGGPAHGSLTLTNNGGFSYAVATNYLGMDGFTYWATDGYNASNLATAFLMVTTPGGLFYDNFARPAGSGSIFPWINQAGTWRLTNNLLTGSSPLNSYGYAYAGSTNWTDYRVQAKIKFPTNTAWGGAIGGRLNPVTGAHYCLWIYPENSPWAQQNGVPAGIATLQIGKYQTWTSFTGQNLVRLPGMGTNWHDVQLAFRGSNIFAYYDGIKYTNLTDNGSFNGQAPLTNGAISVDLYTGPSPAYTLAVSNVVVAPLVVNDYYSILQNTPLIVTNPGVLGNDMDVFGTNLIAALVNGPGQGAVTLSTNGGFTYTPAANFTGIDSFIVLASDKSNQLGTATAIINVLPAQATIPPVITAIDLTNNAVKITWLSSVGATYRLQYIDTLTTTNWQDVSPDVIATGSTASQTNVPGGAPRRFYRVRLVGS